MQPYFELANLPTNAKRGYLLLAVYGLMDNSINDVIVEATPAVYHRNSGSCQEVKNLKIISASENNIWML